MGVGGVAALLGVVCLIGTTIYMIFWGPWEPFLGRKVYPGGGRGPVETFYSADWSKIPTFSLYPLFGGLFTMIPGMICIAIGNFFSWIIGEETCPIFG